MAQSKIHLSHLGESETASDMYTEATWRKIHSTFDIEWFDNIFSPIFTIGGIVWWTQYGVGANFHLTKYLKEISLKHNYWWKSFFRPGFQIPVLFICEWPMPLTDILKEERQMGGMLRASWRWCLENLEVAPYACHSMSLSSLSSSLIHLTLLLLVVIGALYVTMHQ